MSALSIQPVFPTFTDIDGQPLENGYIWIGQANLDPQANPITVYLDDALTIVATQPIRTIAGYPSNNSAPCRLYVNTNYSIRVMNRNGSTVYSAPEATERYSNAVLSNVAINVTDFGAIGDGVTDDTTAIQAALDAGAGGSVYLPKGVYRCTETLVVPPGTIFYGDGTGAWRAAPFANIETAIYSNDIGSVLLFTGTGTRDKTVDFVTESRQCGFDRPNTVRNYTNSFDAEYLLADFTNKNASGATPATLRQFSVGVILGTGESDSWYPTVLRQMRVVISCPGPSETYGVEGYGNQSTIVPFADWDIGVWAKSPWRTRVEYCQVVGYWNIKGLLATSMAMDGATTETGGYAEFFHIEGGVIQSGLSIRSGDVWPITAKTVNTLTIEWTASHRFASSGTLITDDGSVTYTGLTYTAGSPNTLTFTGCSATTNIVVSGDTRTVIRTTPTAGFANSSINNCEINDFAHATRVEEQSPDFAPRQMPIRAAIEISGHPTRGISFNDVSAYGTSPVALHFGNARDIEFYSCYFEPKSYKTTVGGASQTQGAAFVCGPKATYSTLVPIYEKGIITAFGVDFTGSIGMLPLVNTTPGTRLYNVTDLFNPRGYFNQRRNLPNADLNTKLVGSNGQSVQIISQSTTGSDRIGFDVDTDGNVTIGPEFSGNVTKFTAGTQRFSNIGNRVQFEQTDLALDEKVWEFANTSSAGSFVFRTLADAYSVGTTAWSLSRSTTNITGQTWTIDSGEYRFVGGSIRLGSTTGPTWSQGTGSPEGVVTARVGSFFSRTDGGAGTSFYVKESGTGNTGWVAK